jgi:integrase
LEAQLRAADAINAHRAILLERKPRVETTWQHAYAPGQEHSDGNGGRIVATDEQLIHLGRDLSAQMSQRFMDVVAAIDAMKGPRRPTLATKSADDDLIELYIKKNNFAVGSQAERETRMVWETFKSLVGKPLKDCTRDDGRKLVAHFEAQGDKSATVKKKVGRVCAAVNLAIAEGKLTFNCFSGVAKLKDDKLQRLPFDDSDMAICFANIDELSASDQLLGRVVASTGMRLGEAYEIDREYSEKGIRFVIVGTKNAQSKRRVPLPEALLPHLPAMITAPLLDRDGKSVKVASNIASSRLNRWLDSIGIDDPHKVANHSWRHRAQDVMRAEGCPPEIREELFGREKQTVSAGYGKGHPVTVLKAWIDKIFG